MSNVKVAALFAFSAALVLSRQSPAYSSGGAIASTTLSLFAAELLLLGIWYIIIRPKFLSPLRNLPGPKDGNLLLGQLLRIAREPTGHPFHAWNKTIPNDGLLHYNYAFNAERLLVTNPKGLAEVLVTKNYDFIKPARMRTGLARLLGVGILLAEGDEHKRQRKNLNPAFTFRHTKELFPIFWTKAREITQTMKGVISQPQPGEEKASPIVEIGELASRATLDIIGVAGMGQDFGAIADPESTLNKTYRKIFTPNRVALIMGLLATFIPERVLALLPVQRNDDIKEAAKVIRKSCHDLIQSKKAKLARGEATDVDILSVALQSGGFTDDNLVDQLMTFLAAGHETTASSLTWAVHALCENPDMQKRLREEIRQHLPSVSDPASSVTAADIEDLPYLHAVCNEVLRFNPPVPMTLREAAKDSTILGQFVPKGTTVILSPYAVNRSPALWGEDAEKFNPERWMAPGKSNSGGADSNYSFMTFLHGPRSCIGQAFAKAEFAVILAAWIGTFEMELAEPDKVIEITGGVTARPRNGLKIRLSTDGKW